jgi:hypothetical protein
MEFMDNPPIYENYGNYKTAGGQGWHYLLIRQSLKLLYFLSQVSLFIISVHY